MPSYPVTKKILTGLKHLPDLAKMIVLPDGNRSEKEIFRLLGNTHYGHINQLLQYLDQHISSTGEIGKRLLEQTDYFQFNQVLAEFFLLAHLQSCPEVHVKVAKPNQPSDKCHDIDLHAENLHYHSNVMNSVFARQYLSILATDSLFNSSNVTFCDELVEVFYSALYLMPWRVLHTTFRLSDS